MPLTMHFADFLYSHCQGVITKAVDGARFCDTSGRTTSGHSLVLQALESLLGPCNCSLREHQTFSSLKASSHLQPSRCSAMASILPLWPPHLKLLQQRGAIKSDLQDWHGVLADLDAALELGIRTSTTFRLRGSFHACWATSQMLSLTCTWQTCCRHPLM